MSQVRHCFLLLLLCAQPALANTFLVGPTQNYTKPSQVANLVQNGDTVLIEAGIYPNDVARWTAHNLLIRGIGGLAHLKCGGNVYGGKAIWVIVGNDVTVENMEFSEAACPDQNGAGIRSEGINLTLRSCYFHDNENGVLAGDIASGDFLIEHCEFSGNGFSNGQAHNLYINHANSLTFRYNYSHDAKVGHELKSRAYNNFIYYNRFSDENGTSSRSIDLPNGGFAILMGNIIVQDQFSENNNILAYGMEGLTNPNSQLYVVSNTFVNNKTVGSFIDIAFGTTKLKAYNNIFAGPGWLIGGTPLQLDTLANKAAPVAAFGFADAAAYDFRIASGSIAAAMAVDAGMAGNYPLSPTQQYIHPSSFQPRVNTVDIGAFAVPVSSGLPSLFHPVLHVYPNPAYDFLMIDGAEDESELQILDTSGKIWMEESECTKLNLSALPAGIYLLKLKTNRMSTVKIFVKL